MKANIKRRATGAVAYAKKVGNLPCPQRCELCEKETSNLVAHHPDYSKPLEVVWLCHSCHSRVHASGLPFEEQDRLMRQITFLDGRPLCPYCGTIRMARAGGNPSGEGIASGTSAQSANAPGLTHRKRGEHENKR